MSRFSAVVREAVASPPTKWEERSCPDQCVGALASLREHGSIVSRCPASSRPSDSSVLLILESPHTHEFKGELGPAKGGTGRLIAKHMLSVPGLDSKESACLVLINAVQYQCSLGEKPTKYRDEVFVAAWREFGRSDFVARVAALFRTDYLVVCACTRGELGAGQKPLRQLVYEALVEALPPQARVLRRTHPSNWYSEARRAYDWTLAP